MLGRLVKRFYSNTVVSSAMDMTLKSKVAVCQMRATNDKTKNYEICKSLIEKAKAGGAEMVFLPECCDYVGSSNEEMKSMAETVDGPVISRYKDLAQRLRVWLSLGGFHRKLLSDPDERFFNSHLIVDADGQIQACYDKVHLFDFHRENVSLSESETTIGGEEMVAPVITPAGKVGLGICYDLRFPEMSRWLRDQGAEILTFPSAFTVPTGEAHWHTLLRARAIENQCYVVAAAQIGQHNTSRESYGHSLIVDPWGTIMAECAGETDVRVVEVDLARLYDLRRTMPVDAHRRVDLYSRVRALSDRPTSKQMSYPFGHVVIDHECVFYRTDNAFCFVNIKPVVPGHSLISPLEPVERFVDLRPDQVEDLFITVQKVAGVLQKVHKTDSVTVAIQDGPLAGQTIKHVHVHVLPRREHDLDKNDDIYDKLALHDAEITNNPAHVKVRSKEEMATEAAMMRQHFYDHS